MRRVNTLLLVVTGLAIAFLAAGCDKATTTTTGSVETSLTPLAPSTSPSVSSTNEPASTSAAPSTTPTTSAGGLPFPELVHRYRSLLETVIAPGILPYSLLPAGEVASLFEPQTPVNETNVQGFRLANGDTVVLYAPPLVSSNEAFTSAYGGGGREVFAYSYSDYGYLVASKDYAKKLGIMVMVARDAPSLEAAIATVQDPTFGGRLYK